MLCDEELTGAPVSPIEGTSNVDVTTLVPWLGRNRVYAAVQQSVEYQQLDGGGVCVVCIVEMSISRTSVIIVYTLVRRSAGRR